MSVDRDRLTMIRQALAEHDPEGNWLRLLETFLPTGVADTKQIQKATGLSRHQVNRLLERMKRAAAGGPPLVCRVQERVPRPGVRGRGPVVYRLAEGGAALLREAGHAEARPCGLNDPTPIAHALATLEVRLAAEEAGLPVQTERELSYDDGRVLRPDNLITLPDGTVALFETEQAARPALLRRIIEGLRHKVAFFRSSEGKRVSPTVRVLFFLPRGREWERTLTVWERAVATVARQEKGDLPFRLLAMPLGEFLERPDWAEPPADARWENLLDPARLEGFAPGERAPVSAGRALARGKKGRLPRGLARRSSREDRLILAALWQVFREEAACGERSAYPYPDPAFFDVMGLIYAASHDPQAPPLRRAAVPYASLYLLREYLRMHPLLRQALSKGLVRGGGAMRWNATNILHRMQVVIAIFLKYHGWRAEGPLLAYPTAADWGEAGTRTFGVTVRIREPELLVEGDGVVPGRDEVERAEEALAWVLWALFAYAPDLGLKTPPFW